MTSWTLFCAVSTIAYHLLSKLAYTRNNHYHSLSIRVKQIFWCIVCSSSLQPQFLSSKPCPHYPEYKIRSFSLLKALTNRFLVSWRPQTTMSKLTLWHQSFSPRITTWSKKALLSRICFRMRRLQCLGKIVYRHLNSFSKQHPYSLTSNSQLCHYLISSLSYRCKIRYFMGDLSLMTTIAISSKPCKNPFRFQLKSSVSNLTKINILQRGSRD